MAQTIFGRREGDSLIPNTKLQVLYCMVHDIKIDLFHVIALKLKDVAQSFNVAIKIGGLVMAFIRYADFDIEDMSFERVNGREMVNIIMM